MKNLNRQDMEDLLSGGLILGCGGGGEPQVGEAFIDEAYRKGKDFYLIDIDEIKPEGIYCLVSYVGGGISEKEEAWVKDLKKSIEHPILKAVQELSRYVGKEFSGYYPSEIGAGNTIAAMFVSAIEGKPTIDGDTAGGRAKPETAISTTHVAGIPASPVAIVNAFGEVIFIEKCIDDDRVEMLCRYVSRISGGRCAAARCPVKGKDLKSGIYSGSISLAMGAGRAVRTAKKDPVSELIRFLNGKELFRGEVAHFVLDKKQGFNWGKMSLAGTQNYKGMSYQVWYKNEHLVAWKNGRVDITCPDSIMVVDAESGKGLYNKPDDFWTGRKVAVIGRKAGDIWRTEKGLEIFGPRHFGFDMPYKALD